jgi:hypothetical protein
VGEDLGLSRLSEADLISLRAEIDQMLPVKALADMNLERALVLQFITVQNLLRTVLADENVPANQQAQTSNATSDSPWPL